MIQLALNIRIGTGGLSKPAGKSNHVHKRSLLPVFYLFTFQLQHKDVIIQPPIGKTTLAGDVKYTLISLPFVGFIAVDLLYYMMRYRITIDAKQSYIRTLPVT